MFDDALLESRKAHALGGMTLSLPVAIGLHAAVIAAFVGASAWITGDPPEPVDKYSVCGLRVNLAPPPKGSGETPGPTRGPRTQSATVMSRPNPSRTDLQTPVQDGQEAASAESDVPANGQGFEEGRPNGTGTEIGGTGEPDPEGDAILRPGGDVRAPLLLRRVEPEYPESARRAHLEGVVILEAVITTAGEVQEVKILKTVNPLLDEAAVRAVRQWRYRPATLSGRAVPVYLTVTVKFGLP